MAKLETDGTQERHRSDGETMLEGARRRGRDRNEEADVANSKTHNRDSRKCEKKRSSQGLPQSCGMAVGPLKET